MDRKIKQKFYKIFSDSFIPPFTGSITQWLGDNVKLEDGTDFNIGVSPWLREVYQSITNPDIETVILEGATGTYKTGVNDSVIMWWIANDAGKVLRIHPVDEIGKDFTKTRLVPMMESCKPVKALFNDKKIKPSEGLIKLPHMDIKVSGPSDKIQHGYSCRFMQIDDAQLIAEKCEKGLFEKLFKRVRKNFGRRKIILTATGAEKKYSNGKLVGDELAVLINSGRILRRAWKCPNCSEYQVWRWSHKREKEEGKPTYSGINWGDPILHEDKSVNVDKTASNAKLECHYCRHQVEDTETARVQLEQSAKYLPIKSDGDPKVVTYQWPAWVAPFNSFKDSALQYFKAKDAADGHNFAPLKEFFQQVVGEDWDNKSQKVSSKLTFQSFDSSAEWPEEKFRFMGVDLQADGRRYYMIVAFDALGNARVITYGVARSWEEIELIAIKFNVQKADGENAHFVGVDCGYDWSNVAKETVKHGRKEVVTENGQEYLEHFGWLMLRGEQKDSFEWEDGIKRSVSMQQWYETSEDDPPARLHFWSNKSVKNLVASIRDGNNRLKLSINTEDEKLQAQIYSEFPDENGDWKQKVKGNDNHWWDCLCEAYAMATLARIPFYGLASVPQF